MFSYVENDMIIYEQCYKPIHADGFRTPQLLLPSFIEFCNNFLRFLLAELK